MSAAQPPGLPQQQQTFPPPPPFYTLYRSKTDDDAPKPPGPPPPLQGEYQSFGELHTTEDGLPPLQGRQLYHTADDGTLDFKVELQKLSKELLFNFLELLHILIDRPSAYARQVESIGMILRNIQHLLNLLRPIQARATLAHTLRLQIQERKAALADIRGKLQRTDDVIATMSTSLKETWGSGAEGKISEAAEGDGVVAMEEI